MTTARRRLLNLYPGPEALRCGRLINFALVLALSVSVVLAAGSSIAMAQVTTTQFASGLVTPQGGLVLSGTAINPATGKPFRHLWTADATNGFCRLDPDVDTVGLHAVNPATCLSTVAGKAFNASQLTLDPATNTIYAVDGGGKVGIFVLNFLPDLDSGHGLLDQVNQSILAGTAVGQTVTSGCGITTAQPNATSLGPDGNLYVGFRRNGDIMRIIAPLTNPLPCSNVQPTVISTGDKLTSQMAWVGHTLYLNDSRFPFQLDRADQCLTPQNGNTVCVVIQPVILGVAPPTTVVSDQTAGLNGDDVYFGGLGTVSAFTGLVQGPVGVSGGTFIEPFGGANAFFSNISALALDSSDPASSVLYVGDDPTNGAVAGQGRWWQVLSAPPPPAPPSAPLNVTATAGDARATVNWTAPVNHQPVTSYTVHNSLASDGLPVADVNVTAQPGTTVVPTGASVTGLTNGVTYQFEVLASNAQGSGPLSAPSNSVTPQAATAPGAPTGVVASAGNASAAVAWTAPTSNGGSPITGYTVTALTAGVPSGITATAGGGATGVVVTSLSNGLAYTFTVHATNAIGNGPESATSAPVTPAAVTVPGAPPNVVAIAGDAQATVFWLAPANDGGSPITSYTVTTISGGLTIGAPVTVAGTTAGIAGLVNGTAYTFTVHATNAAGNGPESAPSAPVTPSLPPPDMAITMTGPASVIAGGNAVYTLQVSNLGPSTSPAVTVSDLATGATVSSIATGQGSCTIVSTSITCNLGAMAAGANVTITVTLKPSAATVNGAQVISTGDPNGANNVASVSTNFIPLAATTDVQVVGSAQNGGPAVTATDTFTWQIKNNQPLAANAVHFTSTLAPGMVFQNVSSTLGTCSAPAAGTPGATFTCDLATLNGGQAMIVTVNVTFNAVGSMSTSGQATFSGIDNNPANNSTSITIGVK